MGETTNAVIKGAASGLAPCVVLGVGVLVVLGVIEAKFDVMDNAGAAKDAVDTEIKTDYAEKVYTVDVSKVQRNVADGTYQPLSKSEASEVKDQIGEIDIMTQDQFDQWANDPLAYQDAYSKAHGWEV